MRTVIKKETIGLSVYFVLEEDPFRNLLGDKLILELLDDLTQRCKVFLTDSEALWLGWFFENVVRLYVTFEA